LPSGLALASVAFTAYWPGDRPELAALDCRRAWREGEFGAGPQKQNNGLQERALRPVLRQRAHVPERHRHSASGTGRGSTSPRQPRPPCPLSPVGQQKQNNGKREQRAASYLSYGAPVSEVLRWLRDRTRPRRLPTLRRVASALSFGWPAKAKQWQAGATPRVRFRLARACLGG
jgi:hypothetical protein